MVIVADAGVAEDGSGGDMRPRILSHRSQFARTRPRYQKRQRFFTG